MAVEVRYSGNEFRGGSEANKKILIVDVRLKANGYDTFFASDAISCIAEARKNQPDLILLDQGLPAGDGFLVMERFKAAKATGVPPPGHRVEERKGAGQRAKDAAEESTGEVGLP